MEKVILKLQIDEDIVKTVTNEFRCELDLHFCQNQLGGKALVDAVHKYLHDLYGERRNNKTPPENYRTKEGEFAMKITVLNDLVSNAREKSIFSAMNSKEGQKFSIGEQLYGIDVKNIKNQRQIQQEKVDKLEKIWIAKKATEGRNI